MRTSRTPALGNGPLCWTNSSKLRKETSLVWPSMQIGTSRGIEVQPSKRVDGDANTPSANSVTKSLNNYSLLLAPGVLGGIFASIVYPLLDQGPLVTCGLCILFLPVGLQLRSMLRKSQDVEKLREAGGLFGHCAGNGCLSSVAKRRNGSGSRRSDENHAHPENSNAL